jgi:hypothetical protein
LVSLAGLTIIDTFTEATRTEGVISTVKDKIDGSELAFTFTGELLVGIFDTKDSDIHR